MMQPAGIIKAISISNKVAGRMFGLLFKAVSKSDQYLESCLGPERFFGIKGRIRPAKQGYPLQFPGLGFSCNIYRSRASHSMYTWLLIRPR
jgi:hypothetical protein